MSTTIEYFKYQEEFTEKYGDYTVVLMQIGSFYEIYEYDPEKDTDVKSWPSQRLGVACDVYKLLNMRLTSKDNNKPYSLTNPNMCGFPCVAYEKHKDVLLSHDYTIVRIDQRKEIQNNKEKIVRFIAEIVSPATHIDNISSIPISNNILCLFIEIQKESRNFEDYLLTIGISSIDVTTGENTVTEIYSKHQDAIYAIQETYRYLNTIRPREALVYIENLKCMDYKNFIISNLELDTIPIYNILVNKVDKNFVKQEYMTQFLSKLFSPEQINPNIIEELNLERLYYGTVSYLLLLQFCYEHNEKLIEKIGNPNTSWIDEDKHLILAHNASNQIDLQSDRPKNYRRCNINNRKIDSLFTVVNYTYTSLGKRYLYNLLTNPITDISKLNQTYDMVENLIHNPDIMSQIITDLKKLPDMDRYQRKLYLKLIKPNEFVTLFSSYKIIVKLYKTIYDSNLTLKQILFKSCDEFNQCLTQVFSKINLSSLASSRIEENTLILSDESIFYQGINKVSDKYVEDIKASQNKIESITHHLNTFLKSTRGKKLEYVSQGKVKNSERGLALWTTQHKAKILKSSSYNKELCGELQFINVNKEIMIVSEIISSTCNLLLKKKKEFAEFLYSCYTSLVFDIAEKYNFFSDINRFISELDYLCSNALSAKNNKYFRPIIDQNAEYSYLDIKNLRHPIVEKIIDGEYVTNDITLGKTPIGMLLYGSNSVGKSCFTKAVGLNIIMAQAGLFTACNLTYYPYTKIITRLSGNDNLIQGESSFVIEMKELRTILRNADRQSLVLGDELCRGTESVSGTSLTITTIETLINRKSSFIFSTHMHHLNSFPMIKELPDKSLQICHLTLRYDPEDKILIYDRKLKEGPGDSIYGLEVAMSLSIDSDFLKRANQIRRYILNKSNLFLSTKTSNYNSKSYITGCFFCGEETDLHTHHIKEQSEADSEGFIDTMHKDVKGNHVYVCKTCHVRLHKNGIKIQTEETSKGIKLLVN